MTEAENIAKTLNMQPHPEGGFYKETYRSKGLISENDLDDDISGKRNFSTGIYFLLTSNTFSAFHRIKQDEMWHFYKGSPLKLHIITDKEEYSSVIIGNNIEAGEVPQFTVNARDWFASEVVKPNDYSLVGCTVSPGFDFKDFELPEREFLISKFPQHSKIITKLTRI
ncbi:cupin domain-containing protein [Seonamhaeicola sp. MEBiC1930]|uniref:cupin domain-containing protein n=1 Tax=Seonamhaeicola sp. MEBiC01930 TaxID=2976768 RepID=UPI0032521A94